MRQRPFHRLALSSIHRKLLASVAVVGLGFGAVSAAQAADVDIGVSIGISQPGVYGRIDIGRFPQPQVVVTQPVIMAPQPVVVGRPVQPVYMWVPPGHRKNWRKHCADYRACGVPVVFVRDDWYASNVQPHAHDHDQGRKGGPKEKGYEKGSDKGHGKGRGRDD